MTKQPFEAAPLRTVEPSSRAAGRVLDLVRYRELLVNLVRKELRVKYKNSALGFVWSMLNPAMYLVIFWIVFDVFLGQPIPNFPIYLLAGLLAFNLWSASLGGSVGSLIGNASLVTKVYFPREILPLSAIGASLIHFFFQLVVLVAALILLQFPVSRAGLVLVPAALATEILLLVGVCLIVSVLNVYFRDVQHLLELVLLGWFWMTPIVYPISFVQERLPEGLFRVYMLNPMTTVVLAFQRGIYGLAGQQEGTLPRVGEFRGVLIETSAWWYLRNLGFVLLAAAVLLGVGWTVFRHLESRLAEEL